MRAFRIKFKYDACTNSVGNVVSRRDVDQYDDLEDRSCIWVGDPAKAYARWGDRIESVTDIGPAYTEIST